MARIGLPHSQAALLVLVGALALACVPGRAESPRILDAVDLSSAPSRTAHGVRVFQGAPRADRVSIGTLTLPVAGIALQPGGTVRLTLQGGPGPVSVLLTLATAPDDYGKAQAWSMSVNGRGVARWQQPDPGGGVSQSWFVDVEAPGPGLEVVVSCEPDSRAPVTVSALRVYGGLLAPDGPPGPPRRMGLALLSPHGSGYSFDAAQMRAVYHLLPMSPHLVGQLAVLYSYSTRGAAENATEVARLAGLAEETGVPLRIAFQTHWAGTPRNVPDGAGGTFGDVPYQQITFDPDNHVEAPGLRALMGDRFDPRFGLSVPNRWGDTPWLTFNHPRLNQLRRIRLMQAVRAWRAARERLVAAGKGRLLPPQLSTGEETIYWAKGVDDSKYAEANGGKPRAALMADFNPFVVADALRDEVNLDPRDGLDTKERGWLHLNLARQQQRVVDWMLDAVPPEPVRLEGGQPQFTGDLVRRNIYTEPYAMPFFPMKDISPYHPCLEVGYVLDGRSGGEYWSGAAMMPWLLKERERGRIALPNLECTGADDAQLVACLQAAYAAGARFATLYNWQIRQNTPALLRSFADSIDAPPAMEWLPAQSSAPAPAPPPAPAAPAAPAAPEAGFRRYTAPAGAFGLNRIDLFVNGAAPGPADVRITLRRAEAGPPLSCTVAAVVTPGRPITAIALPSVFPQEPGHTYIVDVEAPQGLLVRAADGQPAMRLVADITAERARSLAVEDWQDAVDVLESLIARHKYTQQSRFAREALLGAERMFAAGEPQNAYRAAARAEQLSLPASYAVPAAGGRLAPYWIGVSCSAGPVTAAIKAYTEDLAVVQVQGDVAQTVTVRWGTRETAASLTPGVAVEVTLSQPKAAPIVHQRPRRRVWRARRWRAAPSTAPSHPPASAPPAAPRPARRAPTPPSRPAQPPATAPRRPATRR